MSRALALPTARSVRAPAAPRTLEVSVILVVMVVAFGAVAVGTVMPRVPATEAGRLSGRLATISVSIVASRPGSPGR